MTKNKTIFILFSTLFLNLNANAFQADIQGFDGKYNLNKGDGIASKFSLIVDKQGQDYQTNNVKVTIEDLKEEGTIIRYGDNEVILEENYLAGTDHATWNGLDFTLNNSRINLNLRNAFLATELDSNRIDNLKLNCPFTQRAETQLDTILVNCLRNSTAQLGQFYSQSAADFITDVLNSFVEFSTSNFKMEQIQVSIKNGAVNASIKVDLDIKATIKLEGSSQYDVSEKVVKLKIDRARVGILNITGKLFDELKKMESDSISVQRPYVFIKVQN